MRSKVLVSGAALLAMLFTAARPAAGQEETRRSGGRAAVGAVIGAAAGAAAAFIYYKAGNCHKGNDYYDSVWLECVAPGGAMVAGGATAGFFIGRSVGRRSRTAAAPPRAGARIVPAGSADIPPMRMRVLQPNRQPPPRPYLALFTAQMGENGAGGR